MKIFFTPGDLSRISVSVTLGPIAETVFALALLGRPGSVVYEEWRAQVHRALGGRRSAVGALTRALRPVPDLLWLLGPAAAAEDERRLVAIGRSRPEVAGIVQDFCRLAVAPYWARGRRYLGAEREALGRILTTGGVEQLLAMVHPQARWAAPVLSLPLEPARDVRLDGRGLVITPSLFLGTAICVLVDASDRAGRATLVCPTPPNRASAGHLWDGAPRSGEALAALVGRTRAGLLDALTDSGSTGDLARRVGISTAAASQHTAIMRRAGLITTRRNQLSVLHTITALGAALLGADPGPARYENAMHADPDGGLFAG